MKNQINIITFVIIISIISLLVLLYILISSNYNQKTMQMYNVENQYTLTIQNSIVLLSYINDNKVNLSYAFLLSYFSSSGNDTYCINQNICTNISQTITNYFNSIYGNRWNLTIYFVPPITGWIVQMFVVAGNINNWDPCSMRPPPDQNGKQWYEWGYTYFFTNNYTQNIDIPVSLTIYGAGWVNATAPFHQTLSTNAWGLQSFYPQQSQEIAIQSGYCNPLSRIFPNHNFTEASVYCPNSEWHLFPNFLGVGGVPAQPVSNLPNFFSGFLCIYTGFCPATNNQYLTSQPQYYQGPPVYKTATDINRLADFIIPREYLDAACQQEFGTRYIGNSLCGGGQVLVVGSFYRGVVNIPSHCQQVFIDYPWHETIALYISYLNKNGQPDYVFLAADPLCEYKINGRTIRCPTGVYNDIQNINGIVVGKECPLVYLGGINTYAQGFYRFNITKWIINNRDPNTNQFIVSAVYYDPHVGSNGVAMARAYCITDTGNKEELNAYIYQGSQNSVSLGYPIPPNTNIYVYYIYLPVDMPFLGGYLVSKLTVW
jgi:hypothetical protein